MKRFAVVFGFFSLFCWSTQAQQQTSSELDFSNSDQNSLLQEQAAICASYARVMEYTGLLEENQGALWRERRFFAGAMLRQSMAAASGVEPNNANIDDIIQQYSGWIIGLFSSNSSSLESEDTLERDKLKQYIANFCASLFNSADRAIAKVKPELFSDTLPSVPSDAPLMVPDIRVNELMAENRQLRDTIAELQRIRDNNPPQNTAAPQSAPAPSATSEYENVSSIEELTLSTAAAPVNLTPARNNAGLPDDGDEPFSLIPDNRKTSRPATADGNLVEELPPLDGGELGMTQIQLAAYSSTKNAKRGLSLLMQKLPQEHDHISLEIVEAKLASGKDVYRIISRPIDISTAKSVCSHFWSLQYGCIIKMTKDS